MQTKNLISFNRIKQYFKNIKDIMVNEMNYSFDAKFEGNISKVGRTWTFLRNLGKNKMFREIKEVIWVLKILLSKDRENNIREYFVDKEMGFKYPNNRHEFDDLLDYFQRQRVPCNNKVLGEKIKLNRFIVMDDVSDLAGKSEASASFLTVSRKLGLTWVYIFHTFYPTRQNWQMILVQKKIFTILSWFYADFFNIILSSFCSWYKYNYVPNRDLWINRLYFDISNSTKKQCLTIDTGDGNDVGPAKFRTQTDSSQEQICYYNRNERDTSFNSFLAVRKQTSTIGDITFSIVKIIDKTNKNTSIYLEINDELSDFNNGSFKRPVQWISEGETRKETSADGRQERNTTRSNERISKKPNFFHDNNDSNKLERKYTATRIKSRNFVSNISYIGINKTEFYNEIFIFNVYLLFTKNVNPFSLDRKLND